jgi:hypothetical protein
VAECLSSVCKILDFFVPWHWKKKCSNKRPFLQWQNVL